MSTVTFVNELLSSTPIEICLFKRPDKSDDGNYYGLYDVWKTLAPSTQISYTQSSSEYITIFIVFDPTGKCLSDETKGHIKVPLGRFMSHKGDENTHHSIGPEDIAFLKKNIAFVEHIMQNGNSDDVSQFNHAMAQKGIHKVKAVDNFFRSHEEYEGFSFATYMLAMTFKAQVDALQCKNEQLRHNCVEVFRLKTLLESAGVVCPEFLENTLVGDFNAKNDTHGFRFQMYFIPDGIDFGANAAINIAGELVKRDQMYKCVFQFSEELGLGYGACSLETDSPKNVILPMVPSILVDGGTSKLRFLFDPKFKFGQIQLEMDLKPFTSHPDLVVKGFGTLNNIEFFISLDLEDKTDVFQLPELLDGIEVTKLAGGVGLLFEEEMPILGVQADLKHKERGSTIDFSDNIALIFGVEGDVPVPVYLSFYATELTPADLCTLFSHLEPTISAGLDIEFHDVSIWWNANPMAPPILPDGTVAHAGYGFSCYAHIFGLRGYADFAIDYNGVKAQVDLSPVDIDGIFKLTGNSKPVKKMVDKNGAIVKNNTVATKPGDRSAIYKIRKNATLKELVPGGGAFVDINLQLHNPHVKASARLEFLDLFDEEIEIHDNEMDLNLNGTQCRVVFGNPFQMKFTHDIRLTFDLTEQSRTTPTLRHDASVAAYFDVEIASQNSHAHLEFNLFGKSISVTIPLQGIVDIASFIARIITRLLDDVGAILEHVWADVNVFVGWLKSGVVTLYDDLPPVLKEKFNLAADEFASVMHDLGRSASEVGEALKQLYSLEAQAAGQVMKAAGWVEDEVEDVFKNVYHVAEEIWDDIWPF